MFRKNRRLTAAIVIFVLLCAGLWVRTLADLSPRQPLTGGQDQNNKSQTVLVADGLKVPWGLAELPDGDMLVTERAGTLKRIGKNKQSYPIRGVEHTSEGGLLGITLHPEFESNNQIYIYYTTKSAGKLSNVVERYVYKNDKLSRKQTILQGIPGSSNHDGGRLAFGPDKHLYITTGDASNDESAQDTTSLAGKILRITAEGSIPAGNPFGNAVYSYGHRNPQGIAWDDNGMLWATEHGRSGIQTGYDELNLIKKGANYGWPIIEGDAERPGMERPVLHSGAEDTWAPAGLAYAGGSLYFGGLRGQALYQANIRPDGTAQLRTHLQQKYGRLRTTAAAVDGMLYVTTSNTDGRGKPKPGDDRILRIQPESLND